MTTFSPDRPDVDAGGGRRRPHPGLALGVIASAQLMVVLDATIVNIALPHIRDALHFSQTSLAWVLNAYTLTFGGLLLLGGRMGDLFGRRRMFITGVLLFALASLAGGFAQDQTMLLAMRALQGIGGAIASPTALALITTTFAEGPARNKAFGVYAAVSGAGAAIGLILGGVLTDALSWRWVLFVNAPIGIALAVAAPFVTDDNARNTGRLDIAGALTSTLGMASLVYGLIHAASDGWSDAVTVVALAVAVPLLVAFVVVEARTPQPLMPLRLFRDRTRVGTYVVMLIVGAAVFAMFFFLTQFVQEVLGFSPLKAGFAFLPVSAVIVVMAQVASRLVTKLAPRNLIASGTLLAGGGLWLLSHLSVHSTYATGIVPPMLMIAAGMGLIFVPITLGAVAGVAPEDSGIASAMLNVGQQVGGTLGLSALITVFGSAFDHRLHSLLAGLSGPPTQQAKLALLQQATVHGWDSAFRVGAYFALAGFVATLVLIRAESPRGGQLPMAGAA
jgi:EmrB/QacA subfamily drug resistance transporter